MTLRLKSASHFLKQFKIKCIGQSLDRQPLRLFIQEPTAKKKNMGLTNWRGEKIRKTDATVAKNYLNKNELEMLNNLVEQYLLFAEGQALQRKPMYMKDWIKKLDSFLHLNEKNILTHA